MKIITTITDYCKEVNIPLPKFSFYDIRKFEDKVKTENNKQPAFRHEFYAIALRRAGNNKEVNGAPLQANLFFNSPYQVVSWDVLPDWKGWYIMFGQDFLATNPAWNNFIVDYPFFRLDKTIPFDLSAEDAAFANDIFEKIFQEYHSGNKDKFNFIQSYTSLLLLLTQRYFNRLSAVNTTSTNNRIADILLQSRFQTMIEIALADEHSSIQIRKPSFYAAKLNIHPNHLNAVIKRITGKTATSIIQTRFTTSAKSLLSHTNFSIKEVAYKLHFKNPAHFHLFFKKATGLTPQKYRESALL